MTKEKMGKSKWKTVQCLRCDYSWSTKLERPKACPQCRSYWWDAPERIPHKRPKKE